MNYAIANSEESHHAQAYDPNNSDMGGGEEDDDNDFDFMRSSRPNQRR